MKVDWFGFKIPRRRPIAVPFITMTGSASFLENVPGCDPGVIGNNNFVAMAGSLGDLSLRDTASGQQEEWDRQNRQCSTKLLDGPLPRSNHQWFREAGEKPARHH